METLFGLLFFILIILAIIGIFKPSIVKQNSRLKGFFYPLFGAFLSLAMVGVFAPEAKESLEDNRTSAKIDQVQEATIPKVEKVTVREQKKEWYEDGTLHKATVKVWKDASSENKLATVADWLISVPKIREKLENGSRSVDSIKPFAESIVSCVETASKGMENTGNIAEAGALCIVGATN